MGAILFFILGGVALISATLVIIQRRPVHSALFLILTLLCLAGLYLLLNAQFIAAIQVIVYAGAIMVLFLFVIMLLNLEGEEKVMEKHLLQKVLGVILGIFLLIPLGFVVTANVLRGNPGDYTPEKVDVLGNTQAVAKVLFTDFLLPFEITSVLLLVAIVGAVILAKREV